MKNEKNRTESIEMKVSLEDFLFDSLICLNVWNRFMRTWIRFQKKRIFDDKKKEQDEEWDAK